MTEKGHKDMSEDTALIKLMENVLHKIKLGFQLHNENVVRGALEEGEKLLPRLTDKQIIAFLNSQLGNVCSDLFNLNEYKKDIKNIYYDYYQWIGRKKKTPIRLQWSLSQLEN